ncbi:ATP-binding protein [Lacinutrix jangbogonensis]|uniref:ATP-binding protein n=1 Tax=Lacinutrix jangbogonensis TaxID=1469557 RepID=UPI00053D9854|nr:ATP-binding protein [Lacinutrix jangbogonensis]
MHQYKAENAQPNPKSTINSYRSFGYNLSTAIADIIDNSISANATKIDIDYTWIGKESYISIIDNGNGMNLEELIQAMTPGSKDPDEIRNENDLGRFGMGLKTASFSQCKRLTVITKKLGYKTIKRCWDIDFINEVEEWVLLDYISDSKFLKLIDKYESGTIVLWENLDRIVGNAQKDNETVKNAFYQEMSTVKEHLSLVFHRFLENNKIQLTSNTYPIEPWNPFLYNLTTKPEMGLPAKIGGNVDVTYYILPHMSRISPEEYEKSGGPLGWFNQQGFYIYRGDRLLVSGDWLGLEKKRDYSKLARIAVNFPNTGDFAWNLDIKKSTATPPIEVRRELARIAKAAIKKSAKVYNWRGQKSISDNQKSTSIEMLWNDETNREGIKKYKINRKHPIIKQALELEGAKKIVSKTLKLIENNIPLELILYNQNEDPSHHELEKISETPSDELIKLAIDLYKINISNGIPESLARQQIMNSVPFNLFPLINDYLK